METLGFLTLLYGIALFVLAAVWILLPFAVFGLKPKLDQVSEQIHEITGKLCDLEVAINTTNTILAAVHNVELLEDEADATNGERERLKKIVNRSRKQKRRK